MPGWGQAWTLHDKATYFSGVLGRHDRRGFISDCSLPSPGDVTSLVCGAGESDGLWTGIALAAESLQFAVEPSPALQAALVRRIDAMQVCAVGAQWVCWGCTGGVLGVCWGCAVGVLGARSGCAVGVLGVCAVGMCVASVIACPRERARGSVDGLSRVCLCVHRGGIACRSCTT